MSIEDFVADKSLPPDELMRDQARLRDLRSRLERACLGARKRGMRTEDIAICVLLFGLSGGHRMFGRKALAQFLEKMTDHIRSGGFAAELRDLDQAGRENKTELISDKELLRELRSDCGHEPITRHELEYHRACLELEKLGELQRLGRAANGYTIFGLTKKGKKAADKDARSRKRPDLPRQHAR